MNELLEDYSYALYRIYLTPEQCKEIRNDIIDIDGIEYLVETDIDGDYTVLVFDNDKFVEILEREITNIKNQ